MIEVINIGVFNLEGAVHGMRNPMNSWIKSDSYNKVTDTLDREFVVGNEDLKLMRKLYQAGPEHAKYLRQIFVSLNIVAPLYWWKEFDTYKVGTTSNSCSTMHKIHAKEFTLEDFSHENLSPYGVDALVEMINCLNYHRFHYTETNDKMFWWTMIQLLPSSYNQKRTVTMSYANVFNIIHQRENHKLDEWRTLVSILKKLPYVEEIMSK